MTEENDQDVADALRELSGKMTAANASPVVPHPEFLTVEEAAALLRLNRNTLYEVIKAGEAPWAKLLGKQVRISRAALLKWFEQTTVAAPKKRRAL